MTKAKQTDRVLDYIREHGSITHLDAEIHLGVMRLASRINDLKRQGYTITGKMVKVKNRWGEDCRVKQYTVREG